VDQSSASLKKKKPFSKDRFESKIIGKRYRILKLFFFKERLFLRLLLTLFIVAGIFYPYPKIAMWIGFMFAGYSAIANDSIQTIGTFLASNTDRKWWQLWLFIGGIFVCTATYSWITYGGDVSFERLMSADSQGNLKFPQPESFKFLQLAAPLILLLLTRLRMPVSTTFLLLSAFSVDSSGIIDVTKKSLFGYGIAFLMAVFVWFFLARVVRYITSGDTKYYNAWRTAQWVISGGLWSVWIMQDAANIAVFLPRSLNLTQFLFFISFIFFGLGLLFFLRGDKIQKIVTEKSDMGDVRGASIIDFVYACILYFFKTLSNIPMSTTWVFIGLLGGRELSMSLSKHYSNRNSMKMSIRLVGKDILFALIGMIVSVILAVAVNQKIQDQLFGLID
jgi:phosphate/sulfate permease